MSLLNRVDKLLSYLDNVQNNIDQTLLDQSQNNNNNPQLQQAQAQPIQNKTIINEFKPNSGSLPFKIMSALSDLNIKTQSQTHQAVLNSNDHAKVLSLNGILVKNLLITTKRLKTKKQFLVIYPASKLNINLKVFGKYLGHGTGLRTVSDPSITFKMNKGSITPLAILFDDKNIVDIILDSDLENCNSILVHPGTNDATISISSNHLESYINKYGNAQYKYLDLNQFIGDAAKITLQNLKKKKQQNKQNQKPKPKPNANNAPDVSQLTGTQILGITKKKETEFGDWYKEIVTKCELIDYTDISGCYVLRPLSYYIWEQIQNFMDAEIKKLGVRNAYFPVFVSEDALRSEAKHFADFNPEVAWVTHSGDTKLDKKIAVRPTSETIMYPMFAKWIRSFRDLPLKLNQWCNVVRWEFSNPTPFLRTREFLWQEGHTAHSNKDDADKEVYDVLDMYYRTYRDICAVPTIKGIKTKNETFPGADYSTTVEGYIPCSGRGIQGATSHCLGKNFAKMFKINYLDVNNKSQLVIQNSWGFTTRSIGVMIMNHSDNKGLVLPPKVAQKQIVIIPILNKKKIADDVLYKQCNLINKRLNDNNMRSFIDDSNKNPGYKYNEWELKGIPLRIEIGFRDINNNSCMVARRDEREEKTNQLVKVKIACDNQFEDNINKLLDDIHTNLYNKAKISLDNAIVTVQNGWNNFLKELQNGKIVQSPHCNQVECEDLITIETREWFAKQPDLTGVGQSGKAKALCIPLDQPSLDSNQICIHCKLKATKWILFGRSY